MRSPQHNPLRFPIPIKVKTKSSKIVCLFKLWCQCLHIPEPSPPHLALAHSSPAMPTPLLFSQHSRHVPSSGSLHLFFSPRMFLPHLPVALATSLLAGWLLFKYDFSDPIPGTLFKMFNPHKTHYIHI